MNRLELLDNAIVKLEPIIYDSSDIEVGSDLGLGYRKMLQEISQLTSQRSIKFMNSPQSILTASDKVATKRLLIDGGIPTTPMLSDEAGDLLQICKFCRESRHGIFVKPRYGAGAGGIMALRYNYKRDIWACYTTMIISEGLCHNSSRINMVTDPNTINTMLRCIAKRGVIVEHWQPKSKHNDLFYDLRVVVVAGRVVFRVVRCSNGVITNLHLNNHPMPFGNLELPDEIVRQIDKLAIDATAAIGLDYSGVDIMLSNDNLTPYVIEVNGQGDHIYQDIFDGDNIIYKSQIETFCKWKQ